MLERRPAIEAKAGDAGNNEFDRQHITCFAGRIISGRKVDRNDPAVRENLRIEAGSSLGVLVVPNANRVLGHDVLLLKARPATSL